MNLKAPLYGRKLFSTNVGTVQRNSWCAFTVMAYVSVFGTVHHAFVFKGCGCGIYTLYSMVLQIIRAGILRVA